MSKYLYLIRHAKSDWFIWDQSDFERDINQRWKKSIKKIGEYLQNNYKAPDLVLSSPAKRAKKTAEGVVRYLDYKKKDIVFNMEIYDTHMVWYESALACIMEQEKDISTLFFIGHNYAITQLAEFLSWKEIWNIPTCGIVSMEFDCKTWGDISYGEWRNLQFITPKNL